MNDPAPSDVRNYLLSRRRRVSRHLRAHGSRALLAGTTGTGVLAGFLSASNVIWPLLAYIAVAAVSSGAVLITLGLRVHPHYGLPARPWPWIDLSPNRSPDDQLPGRPPQLDLIRTGPGHRAPEEDRSQGQGRIQGESGAQGEGRVQGESRAQNEDRAQKGRRRLPRWPTVRSDDPVYGAGLRVLLPPSRPLVVISSNRRDVGHVDELPLPLFSDHGRRTQVEVDLRPFGIPLAPYGFDRELPDGVQDVDHTLAVKDLVFVPELVAALSPQGGDHRPGGPAMLPEHCVDPRLLADRDVVVIGGPDTNFWHGALFEPVARQFTVPRGDVPLALDLRDLSTGVPVYGSRSMSVQLSGLGSVFHHTRQDRADLDERLYPTYAMVLATRNPFAAAIGRSHWCVFVAGTRSLGTCGAVLGLVRMLRAMQADDDLNFSSVVPTAMANLSAQVSAVLLRTTEVEQAVLRRRGELTSRRRRSMAPEGLDLFYSDSYIPVGVEYLSYDDPSTPTWRLLPA